MRARILHISPQHFFLLFSLITGLLYNIFVPPFQVPDEHDHFRRVYHLANGHFMPEKLGKRLGGEIPVSFREYVHPFRLTAMNLKYTLDEEHYAKANSIALNKEKTEFNDFPNTSNYSLLSYLPQTFVVAILKGINSPWWLIYDLGRIFTYLFWVLIMFLLIKAIPIYKWLFTFILLLPASIYINHSFSADVMTNIFSFSFIVLCLKYAFDKKSFTIKRLVFLILLGTGLAFSKVVYSGLVFAFLLIPSSSFKNKTHRLVHFLILLLFTFAFAFLWSGIVKSNMIAYADYDPAFRDYSCISHCADFEAQKNLILSDLTYFPKVIFRSLFKHPFTYLSGYIGNFGNNDLPLPRPLLYFALLFILFLAITEKGNINFSRKQKLILLIASAVSFILLLLSQHLSWDCVGEGIVDIVQGRYLIPLFPLLFFLLKKNSLTANKTPVLSIFLVLVILQFYSVFLIYNRYTKETYVEKTEWTCDAERLNGQYFATNESQISVEGGGSQQDSVSFDGKHAAKLSPESPYCFTYHFSGLEKGDLIEISAWQKGSGTQMILSGKGKNCGDFYLTNHVIAYENEFGWKRMHYAFTFNQNCTETDSVQASFFLWNPTNTSSFIDNLHFCIKKHKSNYLEQRTSLF